jgi:hypothetical protein
MQGVRSGRLKAGSPETCGATGWILFLTLNLCLASAAWAQIAPKKKSSSTADSGSSGKSAVPAAGAAAQEKPAAGKKAAGDAAPEEPASPVRYTPNEILRDARAEKLVDWNQFPKIGSATVTLGDINAVKAMAQDPNANMDRRLIEQVVDAMVTKLTDHNNIRALVDPPPNQRANDPATHGIQDATVTLLEPLFTAKSVQDTNQPFLNIYNQLLIKKLEPLLRNHLIPRVQAMIILGEAAIPDALKIYLDQIKNPRQTMWVKLWALEGIAKIAHEGGRLPGSSQIEAGKAISDFLDKEDDIPWPVQQRALEALGAMRQGFLPNRPRFAEMANTAMRLLNDPDARLEVRAEAARALGLLQITAVVPRYNYALVSHAIGHLAMELATQIESNFTSNPAKSRYLAALLAGPIFEAFNGVQGARGSGLLQAETGPAAEILRDTHDQIKSVMKAVADVNLAARSQVPKLRKELLVQVASLRDFLEKNSPRDRHLVQGGPDFPPPAVQPVGGVPRAAAPLVGKGGAP